MEPFLFTIGDLVVTLRREGWERGRVAAVKSVRLVAGLHSESLNAFGDAVELLAPPLHSGGKPNVILLVPATIIGLDNTMFKFTLHNNDGFISHGKGAELVNGVQTI